MIALVCIVIISIVIILLVSYYTNMWNFYQLPAADIDKMIASHNIPSIWSQSVNAGDSVCRTYTFISENGEIPRPNIRTLDYANSSTSLQQTCVDDDQLLAVKRAHVCRHGNFTDIPVGQFRGCPLRRGGHTQVNGFYEEYYESCATTNASSDNVTSSNSNRCNGSIGLLTYNFTSSLSTALCIQSSGTNVRSVNGCNIASRENEFPNQLFRVVNYIYDTSSGRNRLVQNNSGRWISIVNRITNTCIAPSTLGANGVTANIASVRFNEDAILIDCRSFNNVISWFYVTPRLQQPSDQIRTGLKPRGWETNPLYNRNSNTWDGLVWPDEALTALPQIIWVPNIHALGRITTNDNLWKYLTNPENDVHSLVPFRIVNGVVNTGTLSMVPFLTYNPSLSTAIVPPSNILSPFHPSLEDCIRDGGYADRNRNSVQSSCNGFTGRNVTSRFLVNGEEVESTNRFIINNGRSTIMSTNNPCYTEYNNDLSRAYQNALNNAESRRRAELGSFQFIDLTLYGVIKNVAA